MGSPVAHSLSPVLHRGAYEALGLGWTYERVEVPTGALGAVLDHLDESWRGLSVTMPHKEDALSLDPPTGTELAGVRGPAAPLRGVCLGDRAAAVLTGAANTLVRQGDGWRASNTDVEGLRRALVASGVHEVDRATVLGGGATARSALVALATLAAREVDLWVRATPRPGTLELAERLGLKVRVRRTGEEPVPLGPESGEVLLGTLPGTVGAPTLAVTGPVDLVLMDVAYDPWPSPLAAAVAAALDEEPGRVVRGTEMLLHQAARQVELMTGLEAPTAAMREALDRNGGGRG